MAQNRMRQQADQRRTEREFDVGDQVFIRLQPYKQVSLKMGGKKKLAPKFYGPYQITKKISQVAYKLQLPNKSRIHNVFHVSCLKKCWGNIKWCKQYFICQMTKEGSFGNQRQSLQPEKEGFVLEHSRNISLGGNFFQMKTHHGRQNNFINNACIYPGFEDKALKKTATILCI